MTSGFMRTSCQDIIKSQQDDDAHGQRGKNRKEKEIERGSVAEEVADATNEVEINANFREEPGQSF